MKYGLWLRNRADVNGAVERAELAETSGWDGVFASDSIAEGWADPWVVLAAVAARTERLALGTWVTPVPQQQPWGLAHTVAAVDRLSGGRVMLGTGLGAPPDHEMLGMDEDPRTLGRRYDESLEIMAALWAGETVDHEGEFFTLRAAQLPVLPFQRPRVPVLPGGWWPRKAPFRRAARWDGVMPFWPALMGGREGPAGQAAWAAAPEDELRELLTYYHDLTDDPGEIIVPWVRSVPGYVELCEELGVSWLLMLGELSDDEVRAGPGGLATP